jgi:DNA polymerase-3 subunit gamma/tau
LPTDEAPAVAPSTAEAVNQGQVLYRKWRPQTFAEVAGQDAVTRTLRNAIASGNLAHAYLFCGPRGTGKTTLGRLLAKAANCDATSEGEPCNKCESCLSFIEGRAMDFIEQDAASHNSVDDVRQLRENVVLTPMAGRRKVYLLDEVHMLSTQAQNALLKTLEEPPAHIIFVLATTEAHKVTGTIVSRCQRFDLKRISLGGVTGRLATICEREGFSFDQESLEEVARSSTGSLRDAINSLEQVVSYYGPSPTAEQVKEALGLTMDARSGQFARATVIGDLSAALGVLAAVRDDGVDSKQFSGQVVQYLRGLLLVQAGVEQSLNLPKEIAEELRAEAGDLPRNGVLRALRAFGGIDWGKERDGPGSSLPLELALIDVCRADAPPVHDVSPLKAPSTPQREPQSGVAAVEGNAAGSAVTATTTEAPAPAQEEAPAPQEAAPVAANGTGDLLDQVRAALRQADRPQADKQLAALLNGSCEIAAVEETRIVLGFYHTFHLEHVETGGFRSVLESTFGTVLGRPVSVAYEHRPRGPADNEPTPAGGHLVRAARERFGARAVPQDD